jgi:hypothetical protein
MSLETDESLAPLAARRVDRRRDTEVKVLTEAVEFRVNLAEACTAFEYSGCFLPP